MSPIGKLYALEFTLSNFYFKKSNKKIFLENRKTGINEKAKTAVDGYTNIRKGVYRQWSNEKENFRV